MVRLQKYLADCGICSRREAEKLIGSGRVSVNGTTASLGQSVEPETDRVELDGVEIARERLVYVVLNKPRDVVTTAKDTHGRKTVLDFLESVGARVFPVGRLDMDVEGALLLTNDGELAYRLLHPKFEVEKTYVAWVSGNMEPESVARLERGVELEEGLTAPARAKIVSRRHNSTLIRLTLHEGRKREVKRMCEAVGHPVRRMRRVQFAGIGVNGLRLGEWRHLSAKEIVALKRLAGDEPAVRGAKSDPRARK